MRSNRILRSYLPQLHRRKELCSSKERPDAPVCLQVYTRIACISSYTIINPCSIYVHIYFIVNTFVTFWLQQKMAVFFSSTFIIQFYVCVSNREISQCLCVGRLYHITELEVDDNTDDSVFLFQPFFHFSKVQWKYNPSILQSYTFKVLCLWYKNKVLVMSMYVRLSL